MIKLEGLTKSYGINKGIFDLSFEVKQGEVFGFLGPNGAGKTTTIRQLLGFVKADQGTCYIDGVEAHTYNQTIKTKLGYLPGEMAFFDQMTGKQFLKLMADLKGMSDDTLMQELVTFFDLDLNVKIKKMSKGMKQKVGLIAAFMHDPEILILDEPTSGLDPLMQTKFVDLILKEKKKGKTILMSSHSFEEIDRTCDRAAIIKDGKLVALEDIKDLKQAQRKIYIVSFKTAKDKEKFKTLDFESKDKDDLTLEVTTLGDINPFLKAVSNFEIDAFDIKHISLEEIFMDFYRKEV